MIASARRSRKPLTSYSSRRVARLHSLQDTTFSCQASSSTNDVIAPHDGHSAMDVMQLPTNRIEQVRSDAFDQAKKIIDRIVRDRAAAIPLEN